MIRKRGRTRGAAFNDLAVTSGGNYYVNGQQHRECVGTLQTAKDLYEIRKADARRGRKLPVFRNTKAVTLLN
jgi:hypothetical protein